MRSRTKGLSVAAVATTFAFAGAGGVALAVPESGSPGNSASDITIEDCTIESSKDISYVDYFADGSAVEKDETVDSTTLDLTTVEGIADIDAVEVKAGTTVASEDITCTTDGNGDVSGGEDDEGDGSDDSDDTGDDTEARGPNANSTATITVEECVVDSTKDISYIEYLADGSVLTKDESINAESFDLTSVTGIEDVDAIEVKAGTTVDSFDITCPTTDTPDDGTGGTEGDVDDETDEGETDDGAGDTDGDTDDGTGETDGKATITLSDCLVQSTKDISNITFFTDSGSWKDESMNSETFDLDTVEGIKDVNSITVKSSTTVESFTVDCGEDTTEGDSSAGVEGSEGTEPEDGTETENSENAAAEEESKTDDSDDSESDSDAAEDEDEDEENDEDAEEDDTEDEDDEEQEKEDDDS